MANYGKVSVRGLYSESSDYSDPKVDTKSLTMLTAPTEYIHKTVIVPTTPGQDVVAASEMSTITSVIVRNNSTASASFITLTGQEAGGTAVTIKIRATSFCVLPGMDPDTAINLTSASGSPECEIFLVGT